MRIVNLLEKSLRGFRIDLQKTFPLLEASFLPAAGASFRPIGLKADVYLDPSGIRDPHGELNLGAHVVDVKGLLTPDYKLKSKLFSSRYGSKVIELKNQKGTLAFAQEVNRLEGVKWALVEEVLKGRPCRLTFRSTGESYLAHVISETDYSDLLTASFARLADFKTLPADVRKRLEAALTAMTPKELSKNQPSDHVQIARQASLSGNVDVKVRFFYWFVDVGITEVFLPPSFAKKLSLKEECQKVWNELPAASLKSYVDGSEYDLSLEKIRGAGRCR